MVIRLKDAIKFAKNIQPIEIRNVEDSLPNWKECAVGGWGRTEMSGSMYICMAVGKVKFIFLDLFPPLRTTSLQILYIDVLRNYQCKRFFPLHSANYMFCVMAATQNQNGRTCIVRNNSTYNFKNLLCF